ncbi:MAG TPA: hypothetical protein VMR54_04585 [Thermoanaerobaculia bacterium]|nr:hypothetical protein [Thermoanaerobaculia bacterium]
MENEELLGRLEAEIERRLLERFAALRDEFDRLRLETDRRWAGFLERFDQDFAGIVPTEMLQRTEGGVPAAGSLLLDEARTLDAAANQVEALHRFLELCRRRASRVALLVSKSGAFGVWKAVGFSEHGLDDEAVRRISIAITDAGPLATILDGSPQRLPRGNEISRRLEASDATDAVIIPMVVKEKISGAVYADAVPGEDHLFDPDGIALLTFLTGLVVDRLASRKLRPAPSLRPVPGRPERPPEEDISDLGIPRPREVPLTSALEPEPSFPPHAAPPPPSLWGQGGPAIHADFEPSVPAEPAVLESPPALEAPPPSIEPRVTGWEEAPAAPIRVPEMPPPSPPPVSPPKPAVSVPAVSPGVRRLAGPLAQAEGDERREEARRFAKLLVSEIKLYNERIVLEGREKGNLYERLKEDIDRSRQMYEERIPEDVRSSSNFFYEELVRTLADGRAEALGM